MATKTLKTSEQRRSSAVASGAMVLVRDLERGAWIDCNGETLQYRGYGTRRGSKLWQLYLYRAAGGLPVLWHKFPDDEVRRVAQENK